MRGQLAYNKGVDCGPPFATSIHEIMAFFTTHNYALVRNHAGWFLVSPDRKFVMACEDHHIEDIRETYSPRLSTFYFNHAKYNHPS